MAEELFRQRAVLKRDEPIVMKTLEGLAAAEPESGVCGLETGAAH